jgi:hypothetical protein
MKKFILKAFLFSFPFFFFIIEGFLPLSMFTYRPWEALMFANREAALYPFYPNQHLEMTSVGDLCHHTKFQIPKTENWVTDKLGFRNNYFIEDPDILIVGDSFVAGCGLSQDATLTEMLKNKTNRKVYNMAPANFNDFIFLIQNKIIQKPEILIYSIVERTIPPKISLSDQRGSITNITYSRVLTDRITRQYSIKYLKSRLFGNNGIGVPGIKDTTLFFLNGINQVYPKERLNEALDILISYKKFCDSIGTAFIFSPLPNKETVYFDHVPFDFQPDYLVRLDSMLSQNKLNAINSLKVFNHYKKMNKQYMYHKDDSHWNSIGVNLVAEEMAKFLLGMGVKDSI